MSSTHPLDQIPPTVFDAADGTNLYPVPITVSMDPKISSSVPLEVLPLRMIPLGGKHPIIFSQAELNRLRKQEPVSPREQQVQIPKRLKDHPLYVEGEWEAHLYTRSDGCKDRVSAFFSAEFIFYHIHLYI